MDISNMEYSDFTKYALSDDAANFNSLVEKAKSHIDADEYSEAIPALFQLLCGLNPHEVANLEIEQLVTYNAEGDVKARDFIRVGKFKTHIPTSLQQHIEGFLRFKNFPPNGYLPLAWVTQVLPIDLRPYFARKLFEVNGYNDYLMKDLRSIFNIRTNSQLLDFAGYKSKEEIVYSLDHVNLDSRKVAVQLPDKSFYNGNYPFQNFKAFTRFLKTHRLEEFESTVQSCVRLLLLLSVYTGRRLSKLIDLRWCDLLYQNDEGEIAIREFFPIDDVLERVPKALHWFISRRFELHGIALSEKSKDFDSNLFDRHVFVTNNFTKIHPKNLSRVVEEAMFYIGFHHSKKLEANTTIIIWARRLIELKGDHGATLKILRKRLKLKSKREIASFLQLIDEDGRIEFDNKGLNIYEQVSFDL